MTGGLDSLDRVKDRIKMSEVQDDLIGAFQLKGNRTTSDGIDVERVSTVLQSRENLGKLRSRRRACFSSVSWTI